MKCYYHPEADAVATCSQCGKASCRSCIEDVGGAMLCKGCYELMEKEVEQQRQEETQNLRLEIERARKKPKRALILGAVWAILNLPGAVGVATENVLVGVFVPVAGFYAGWSLYWGVPPVWRRWKGFLKSLTTGIGCFIFANPLTLFIILVVLCYIPCVIGAMYGIFGGAIAQYNKNRRFIEENTLALQGQPK